MSVPEDVQRLVPLAMKFGAHLDVCFCIDGTGSMGPYIVMVKKAIINAQGFSNRLIEFQFIS